MKNHIFAVLLIIALFMIGPTNAMVNEKLTIGSKAPAMAETVWVKGTPIKKIKKGRIYVFTFWATQCKPCIASMPYLSEIAEKYKANLDVLAINVVESKKKPYVVNFPAVKGFVETNANLIKFNVLLDNNELYYTNNWLKASGRKEIPSAFIVKDKVVQWIGDPNEIDKVIDQIIIGSFDWKAYKFVFGEKEAAQLKQR